MFPFLKNHPFAVDAFFESSIVLTFAVPKEELQNLIPESLELDTFENYAFIAVAMVQTKDLRPKGFPKFLGNDFFLIGYRIFVKYHTSAGKRLRGLYIVKSETNKKKMEFFGNIFTHYQYTTTDITKTSNGTKTLIKSEKSDFEIVINSQSDEILLPEDSVFIDWKEARRFAGPLPFTFTYNAQKKEVLIIEGVRQNWNPKPLQIDHHHFGFLKHFNFSKTILANSFIINNIPYSWKKGRKDLWKP
ncbi:MAG: DUF2071 domain-containing protein [Kaistella sp.]|nr:DUF2071 domain-containing protein [Kaistella sp.]